jgi:peroxin-6
MMLRSLLSSTSLAPDVSLKDLAVQTAALVPSDLADLLNRGERVYLGRAAPIACATCL